MTFYRNIYIEKEVERTDTDTRDALPKTVWSIKTSFPHETLILRENISVPIKSPFRKGKGSK
jgi:hypothetical protein